MTLRPREMATGTRTDRSGAFLIDSLIPKSWVYVPQQCVGTRRCPLIVKMGGVNFPEDARKPDEDAEKYGWITFYAFSTTGAEIVSSQRIRQMDASLQYILRNFAVDPDKIVLRGVCHSGPPAMFLGGLNLHVFSRIAMFAGTTLPPDGMDSLNKTTEFLIGAGFDESSREFPTVAALRKKGYSVKHLVELRNHGDAPEGERDFFARWLQESWATPNPADRPTPPPVVAEPLPLLTTEAVAKLTAFWTWFRQQPDSIQTIARQAHRREVLLPVGDERPSTWMTDMSALAAKQPSVAAALKKAGLTAQQHDAYRAALFTARLTKNVNYIAVNAAASPKFADNYQWIAKKFGAPPLIQPVPALIAVDSTAVPGKNLAFLDAHPDELKALEATRILRIP